MNTTINATPATVRAVSAALQLASLLDDRAPRPDKPRVAAWAEQIERHALTEPDLLDAVQAFYDAPSDHAIAVGELIHHGRRIKRDRLDREADQEREQRQQALDLKAEPDTIHAITAGAFTGPTANRTERLVKAETALQCAVDKRSAQEAIAEYLAAKAEARRKQEAPA
jgi:hypothetical protein